MPKTPEEITNDVLSALRAQNAPEKIFTPAYFAEIIRQHREEAVEEYKKSQNLENNKGK